MSFLVYELESNYVNVYYKLPLIRYIYTQEENHSIDL